MAEEKKTHEVNEEVKQEKKEVATTDKAEVSKGGIETDYSLGIFGSSGNFTMAWQMAQALASSTIVPLQFQKNASNCLIAIEQAQRLSISPMQVMQNMYLINSKPSFSSSFLIAMINASGKYDMELQFDEEEKDGKPYSCICWTLKDGRRVDGIKITTDMADKEGWSKKSGSKWLTIPQVMLRYRAAAFFARMNCPELALGMYTREEYEDGNFSDVSNKKSKASLNDVLKQEDVYVESTQL